jgi:hypothetical protein
MALPYFTLQPSGGFEAENQYMNVLSNIRHEHFAQGLARGLSATKAYIAAGYAKKGARQNASRLMAADAIRPRVKELQTAIAANTMVLEISNRNARVQVLQDLFDRLRNLIAARAKDETMADVPGGTTGLLLRNQGKNADVPVHRADVAVVATLCALMRQAAQELGQWDTKSEKAPFDQAEIVRRLNEGRARACENWEKSQELGKAPVV